MNVTIDNSTINLTLSCIERYDGPWPIISHPYSCNQQTSHAARNKLCPASSFAPKLLLHKPAGPRNEVYYTPISAGSTSVYTGMHV